MSDDTPKRRGRVLSATISGSASQVLGPSTSRVAIVFSPPSTGSYTVSTEAGVTDGNGMVLVVGGCQLTITLETHGDAVEKPWYAIKNAAPAPAPTVMGFIEVTE